MDMATWKKIAVVTGASRSLGQTCRQPAGQEMTAISAPREKHAGESMNRFLLFMFFYSLLLIIPVESAFGADLKTNALNYGDLEKDLDSANAIYQDVFKVSDPNGNDDVVYNLSFNNGGNIYQDDVRSQWPKVDYSDLSAAQAIGYASDLCNSQVTYAQIQAKGVTLTSQEQTKFNNARTKFCLIVKRAAKLKQRIDKYNSIKDNGIVLWQRYAKAKPSYGGKERTIQMGMSLKFYPFVESTCGSPDGDTQTTINHEYCQSNQRTGASGIKTSGFDVQNLQEKFRYDSWLKWSDDNPVSLNIIKKLKDLQGSDGGQCKKFIPIKIIYGGSVTGTLYLGVAKVSSSDITLRSCAVFHYSGDDKTVKIGEITFPAPFGYLGQLEAMRDKAQDNVANAVHNKIQTKVTDLLGDKNKVQSMLYTIEKMTSLMTTMREQVK
jgi:hypothetical protein